MADYSTLRAAFIDPKEYEYSNTHEALRDMDRQARMAMYGPNWVTEDLRADNLEAAKREGQEALAREQAAPGQLRDALLGMTPVIGNAMAARDAVHSAQNGDWLGTGLGALGAVPLVGMVGKAANEARLAKAATNAGLAMDGASRLARAKRLGYDPQPFYRGEATGNLPSEYPGGAYFSRDPEYAAGFAKAGGQESPREFRLNLQNTFHDNMDMNASQYSNLLRAAEAHDPKLAVDLGEAIAPGKGVDWLHGFARHKPDFIVASDGGAAAIRQAIERSAAPESVFKDAGFDAVSNGRDVRKLTRDGIRLKDAAFDPSFAGHPNIMLGLGAATIAAPSLYDYGR